MPTKLEIINCKFGKLTVIKELTKNNSGHIKWLCKCDCGNEKAISGYSLVGNLTKSCGCLRQQKSINNKDYYELSCIYWNDIKKSAKQRNINFDIDIKDAYNLFIQQNKKCKLSGLDLTIKKYIGHNHGRKIFNQHNASLDRIDNNKGYTLNNIQWVDSNINYMKYNLDQNIFIDLCKIICGNKLNVANYSSYYNNKLKITYWKILQRAAKRRKIEFNISYNDIVSLFNKQNNKCSLTNINLSHDKYYWGHIEYIPATSSIDRINPKLGYTLDNIRWIYRPINFMKSDMDDDTFLYYCKLISQNQG